MIRVLQRAPGEMDRDLSAAKDRLQEQQNSYTNSQVLWPATGFPKRDKHLVVLEALLESPVYK